MSLNLRWEGIRPGDLLLAWNKPVMVVCSPEDRPLGFEIDPIIALGPDHWIVMHMDDGELAALDNTPNPAVRVVLRMSEARG